MFISAKAKPKEKNSSKLDVFMMEWMDGVVMSNG
jgi:hypothetical protein